MVQQTLDVSESHVAFYLFVEKPKMRRIVHAANGFLRAGKHPISPFPNRCLNANLAPNPQHFGLNYGGQIASRI
jgi:hypothetical protein